MTLEAMPLALCILDAIAGIVALAAIAGAALLVLAAALRIWPRLAIGSQSMRRRDGAIPEVQEYRAVPNHVDTEGYVDQRRAPETKANPEPAA
jgi:hypothetical protein